MTERQLPKIVTKKSMAFPFYPFLSEITKKISSWSLKWLHLPRTVHRYNWFYHTLPQENCNNRVMYWPRGRVWGGSSSLNAMVYVRGHAADYDRWERSEV